MGKRKKLTAIEIFLILAIIAVLVVWLFPRFLKVLDSNSPAIGPVKPPIGDTSDTGGLNKFPDLKDFSQTSCGLSAFKIAGRTLSTHLQEWIQSGCNENHRPRQRYGKANLKNLHIYSLQILVDDALNHTFIHQVF